MKKLASIPNQFTTGEKAKTIKTAVKQKGRKNFILTLQPGLNGDDFVQDRTSFLITYLSFKKPRFIN